MLNRTQTIIAVNKQKLVKPVELWFLIHAMQIIRHFLTTSFFGIWIIVIVYWLKICHNVYDWHLFKSPKSHEYIHSFWSLSFINFQHVRTFFNFSLQFTTRSKIVYKRPNKCLPISLFFESRMTTSWNSVLVLWFLIQRVTTKNWTLVCVHHTRLRVSLCN